MTVSCDCLINLFLVGLIRFHFPYFVALFGHFSLDQGNLGLIFSSYKHLQFTK